MSTVNVTITGNLGRRVTDDLPRFDRAHALLEHAAEIVRTASRRRVVVFVSVIKLHTPWDQDLLFASATRRLLYRRSGRSGLARARTVSSMRASTSPGASALVSIVNRRRRRVLAQWVTPHASRRDGRAPRARAEWLSALLL